MWRDNPKFGDVFFCPNTGKMPLTMVKVSDSVGEVDVLCLLDSGAESSSFYQKHLEKINFKNTGKKSEIIGSTGSKLRSTICGFDITLNLFCPKTKVYYNYIVPVQSENDCQATLRNDQDAFVLKSGVRYIFGVLGRDILVKHDIDLIARFSKDTLSLEREMG